MNTVELRETLGHVGSLSLEETEWLLEELQETRRREGFWIEQLDRAITGGTDSYYREQALRTALTDTLTWIDNYPLNRREQDGWEGQAQHLRALLTS